MRLGALWIYIYLCTLSHVHYPLLCVCIACTYGIPHTPTYKCMPTYSVTHPVPEPPVASICRHTPCVSCRGPNPNPGYSLKGKCSLDDDMKHKEIRRQIDVQSGSRGWVSYWTCFHFVYVCYVCYALLCVCIACIFACIWHMCVPKVKSNTEGINIPHHDSLATPYCWSREVHLQSDIQHIDVDMHTCIRLLQADKHT